MIRWFGWPVRAVAGLIRAGVVLAMLVVLGTTVGEVVDRQFVHSSFSAYDQFGRLGLVWLTFLGIAVAVRERANIRIELLDHALPPAVARTKAAALDFVVAAVAAYLVYVGWPLLEVGGFQAIMDTPFTYAEVYAALLIGMAVLSGFVALRLVDRACGHRLGLDVRPPATGVEAVRDPT